MLWWQAVIRWSYDSSFHGGFFGTLLAPREALLAYALNLTTAEAFAGAAELERGREAERLVAAAVAQARALSPHVGEATRAHGHAELSHAGLLRRKHLFYSIPRRARQSCAGWRRVKGKRRTKRVASAARR